MGKVNEIHLDASESVFFEKQLEAVKSNTYDVKYAALKARTLVPVDGSAGPAATHVTYRQYDGVGMAKIVASYAHDFPRADVTAKEFTQPIRSLGASYGYNLQEVRAAARAGTDLDTKRAQQARRSIEEKIEAIACTGDAANGLFGLLNQPNALTYTVANGASASATWATKTSEEILKDLNGIAQYIVTQTKEIEVPDTLLIDSENYGLIATKVMSSTNATTVLKHFLATSPYIKNVEPWAKLAGAGAGATNRMVCYRRDPLALELIIPQEFESFSAQQEMMEFIVPCHARIGGVLMYYPLSMAYGDGI